MSTPKERPILFSAPMVRAILDGTKTQTRRIAKVNNEGCKPGMITPNAGFVPRTIENHIQYCPYGKPGDRLWVRETWHPDSSKVDGSPAYKADVYYDTSDCKWKSSIHMPRWASRINLEITGIRVDRLQDISEEDAIAEGVEKWVVGDGFWRDYSLTKDQEEVGAPPMLSAYESYKTLWESLNGKGSFDLNPFVWVIQFKRLV